jgi:hypothetical protein
MTDFRIVRDYFKLLAIFVSLFMVFLISDLTAQSVSVEHCYGDGYSTDRYYFRAWMLGESRDPVIARKKAILNAKSELSGNMQAIIKSVFDHYYSTNNTGSQLDFLTRELINQRLKGVKVICQKTLKTDRNTFITYVAVELPRGGILSDIDKQIANEGNIARDYKFSEFEQRVEAEMEKSGKSPENKQTIR